MVWSEENMSLKNPVTPPGIDPGTVRLVAQHLNHYATPAHIDVRFTLNTATAIYNETSGQLHHTAWLNPGNTICVRGVTNTHGRDDGHIQGIL